MKILVYGSLNIDKVYAISHLPEKGETLPAENYEIHIGGKGLNQAISCKRTGADVYMAGKIAKDGIFLKDFLEENGVNTDFVMTDGTHTGHAVIEVDPNGQNQMIIFGGANREITQSECDKILSAFDKGDLLLLQYETSCVTYMLRKAKEKGLKTAFNPSPFVDELKAVDLTLVDYLILNEDEGMRLSDETHPLTASKTLQKLSGGVVIVTLGADGVVYCDGDEPVKLDAFHVTPVDTTGAGDTFTGFVLFSLLRSDSPVEAMRLASAASALAITKYGAAQTIPYMRQVTDFLTENGF